MEPLDPKVLDRIMTQLDAADRLILSAAVETPSRARQRRLNMRDDLIRRELATASGASLAVAACRLERRMRRAAAGNANGDDVARQLMALSGGRAIGWEHLRRIVREGRTPQLGINASRNAQPVSPNCPA